MSDNPNDQSQKPPDSQDQNQSGQQPYDQPYQQRQPPAAGQVYYPPGYQPPPQGYQQPPSGYQQPPPGYQQPPPGYQQPPPGYQTGQPPTPYNQQGQYGQYNQYGQNQADTGSNSGVWGWVIFILIFGVGNLILYSTTGWFIIPIPRR